MGDTAQALPGPGCHLTVLLKEVVSKGLASAASKTSLLCQRLRGPPAAAMRGDGSQHVLSCSRLLPRSVLIQSVSDKPWLPAVSAGGGCRPPQQPREPVDQVPRRQRNGSNEKSKQKGATGGLM